jgi:cytochrome c peroxidase
MTRKFFAAGIFVLCMLLAGTALALEPIEELGKLLYFDENLSEPLGQSCASCHDPNFGFVDPDSNLPVSEGVNPDLFGGRNSPSAGYAMYAPKFHFDEEEGLWIGGQFWDGRATGEVLGDPLADQALGPFLNPVEMANTSKKQVVSDVAASDYADLFSQVWGAQSLKNTNKAYDMIAISIAAFERSQQFAPFTSKYDEFLKKCITDGGSKENCALGIGEIAEKVGQKHFTGREWRGLQLFMAENDNDGVLAMGEGAMCAACHIAEFTDPKTLANPVIVPAWSEGMVPPMFTDFTFDNLGVPKNEEFPMTGNPIDFGLGVVTRDPDENGKFKVMSLRNIGKTGPYAHNGFFKDLKSITHFYNTRDVSPEWAEPEYQATVNDSELGNLGLSDEEERALVAFMMTLSDQ